MVSEKEQLVDNGGSREGFLDLRDSRAQQYATRNEQWAELMKQETDSSRDTMAGAKPRNQPLVRTGTCILPAGEQAWCGCRCRQISKLHGGNKWCGPLPCASKTLWYVSYSKRAIYCLPSAAERECNYTFKCLSLNSGSIIYEPLNFSKPQGSLP